MVGSRVSQCVRVFLHLYRLDLEDQIAQDIPAEASARTWAPQYYLSEAALAQAHREVLAAGAHCKGEAP